MWPGHYNKQSWQAPSSAAADATTLDGEGYLVLPQQSSILNDFNFTSNLDHLIGSASSIYTSPSTDLSFSTKAANSPASTHAQAMSGTPPPTRIGLDARAAELKEKLLRSRGQSQARANSAHPSPNATRAGVSVGGATPSPANVSEPGVPASDQAKPAQSLPRGDLQSSASNSSGSEASELRQMISSLLAPTPDHKNDGSSPSNDVHQVADEERPKEGEGSSSLQPGATGNRRPGLTRSMTDSTLKANPANPSHGSHKVDKESSLEEGEVASSDKVTLKGPDTKSPLATPALRTGGSRPAAASGGRRESARGFTDPAPVRKGPQEGEATRSEGAALSRTGPKTSGATPVSRSSYAQPTPTSNGRRESIHNESNSTPVRPSAQDPARRDSGSKPHTAASRPAVQSADSAEKLKMGDTNKSISRVVTGMGPPPAIGSAPVRTAEGDRTLPSPSQRSPRRASAASLVNIKHEDSSNHHTSAGNKNLDEPKRHSAPMPHRDESTVFSAKRPEVSRRADEPALTGEAFSRLLNQVPDLRDWLEMTNYDDVETRTRKLDRFRRAKALAAEKRRIEEEERKLMEEEALEMALTPSTVVPLTGVGKGTPVPQDMPHPRPDNKRPREDSPSESRQAKMPRSEAPPFGASDIDSRTRRPSPPGRDVQPPRSPGRGSSPSRLPRAPSPGRHEYRRPREHSPYWQSRPGPRPSAENYGSHEDYPPRLDRSRSYRTYPIPVDLSRKGDTRYFILKSFTEENVRQCMEDGIWTTQVQNGGTFAKAFKDCKNVIFFFSVNKSKAFQGYARMASAPSPDIPTPRWVKVLNWDTSHPFYVEWLSKTSVDFFRIGHLKNGYNENLSVLVGKDGQEIDPQCGADLLREMEAIALARSEAEREDGYQSRRASGGGPWSAGGGYPPDRWGYDRESRYKGKNGR